ncbi:MAG: hypothetical protein JNK87_00070 [Bryobacterales bacterium]|nr:hypothetical protein [Bryobacterales bacterium]
MERAGGTRLLGAASLDGGLVRLTPPAPNQSGAFWLTGQRLVSPRFETEFTFRMVRARSRFEDGSDGLAFVIQNVGPEAFGGIGSAGGFGMGRGGNPAQPGIARSLAIFFDTHRNREEGDPSSNSIGLYTNADGTFPPRRLAVLAKAPARMNDGRPHVVRVRYTRPRLEVFLDARRVLQEAVELETIVGSAHTAYLGFTASTGDGYQQHEILSWRFRSGGTGTSSGLRFERQLEEQVTSGIRFGTECLVGRTLCTPPRAEVTELAPGRWQVLLPPHLPWAASIANPRRKEVRIEHASGTICWKARGTGEAFCHGPESGEGRGAIRMEARDGRTYFKIDTGEEPSANEGYFLFEAVLRE